jgi:hypothetical protein
VLYTSVRHRVQILWAAVLRFGGKSLLWYHRTSPAVVDWHLGAIRAVAWFAKVCWTVISGIYELLKDELLKEDPPPSFSPDRARVLELRRKSHGRWITEPENLDPALFSPNNAPGNHVESTPWSTTCSSESLSPPRLEKQMGVSQEKKKRKPKSPAPQSESLALSSLTVKGVAETKVRLDRFSPEPLHAPVLVSSTPCPPVEISIRKATALHIRTSGTAGLSSHKSLHSKAKITSGLLGLSVPSSPPHKGLHAVSARQMAVADNLGVEKNGVNVVTTGSKQMSIMSSITAPPAVPSLRARLSPMVTVMPTGAVLSVSFPFFTQ